MLNNPPPPRRRWFRFGLRTMFVVLTVLAMFFGWFGWQANVVRHRRLARARSYQLRVAFFPKVPIGNLRRCHSIAVGLETRPSAQLLFGATIHLSK